MTERQKPLSEMPLVGKSFEEVVEIKNSHLDEFSRVPNYSGAGIGWVDDGKEKRYSIGVFLTKKTDVQDCPTEIEGVPVFYIVTGEVSAF